jgi:2-polyprenyl-6-methoxyphenol hydroxylase-like FAD-dependent oxidoreductase
VSRIDLALPDTVPYRFAALPQYETERVLAESLANLGTHVQRGVEFLDLSQDDTQVISTVSDTARQRTVVSQYLIGCDGAHSMVRKGLGLNFEGGAFAEEFMLADVQLDWDLPQGYGVRAMHKTGDTTDDALVCIPLPGRKRYRVSMFVPAELSTEPPADGISHGLEGSRAPELHHIQAVLDRLAPTPTRASKCDGHRSSGSATGWWIDTASGGCSLPATRPTFIRPPVPRG